MAARIALAVLCACAAAGILSGPAISRWLPALSPFAAFSGAIGSRQGFLWLLAAIPLLLLAWRRGTWFCARLCPTGLLAQQGERIRPGARGRVQRWPRIGRYLLVTGMVGAGLGYPLWIWLDPFTLFNGFFGVLRDRATPAAWSLASGLVLVMGASILWPGCWCKRLCPLGALFDGLIRIRLTGRKSLRVPAVPGRRLALGLLAGGVASMALRAAGRRAPTPVRPPGAEPEERFGGVCARCGNCFRICPQKIIQPDIGDGHAATLLTPRLNFSSHYCDEWCHACGEVCPTGALSALDLDAKRHRKIGTAAVTREDCIAWERGGYCMVCQEFCPYLAIEETQHGGVACPTVAADRCRGCGACEAHCPARPRRAIHVEAVTPQETAPRMPEFPT